MHLIKRATKISLLQKSFNATNAKNLVITSTIVKRPSPPVCDAAEITGMLLAHYKKNMQNVLIALEIMPPTSRDAPDFGKHKRVQR